MLLYISQGRRRYDKRPVGVIRRNAWEFQAIISGSASPVLTPEQPEADVGGCLCVFPPGFAHGWSAPQGESCDVAVFHFSDVPDALREVVEPIGWLCTPLDEAGRQSVRALSDQLNAHFFSPTTQSALHEGKAVCELSLLALKDVMPQPLRSIQDVASVKVEQALAWYAENLADGPSVEQVARAVHVSPPHLRRLFQNAQKRSPRRAMEQLQFARAEELILTTHHSLEEIAIACGFSGPAVFSRAFARTHNQSPRQWRQTQINRRRKSR